MIIFIKNLYGLNDGEKAYFRKQGIGCFDSVSSPLEIEEITNK